MQLFMRCILLSLSLFCASAVNSIILFSSVYIDPWVIENNWTKFVNCLNHSSGIYFEYVPYFERIINIIFHLSTFRLYAPVNNRSIVIPNIQNRKNIAGCCRELPWRKNCAHIFHNLAQCQKKFRFLLLISLIIIMLRPHTHTFIEQE